MDASKPVPFSMNRYIRLTTPSELNRSMVKKWYRVVKVYGPSGVIDTVSTIKPKVGPTEVSLVHRKMKNGTHIYDIPLKRDLMRDEVQQIINQWVTAYDQDFTCQVSQNGIADMNDSAADAIVLTTSTYEHLCNSIAKAQHTKWLRDRSKNGWRFGEKVDHVAKTHPMIKAWDDLPEKYKVVDFDLPQLFMDELNSLGYRVTKDE